MLKAKCFSTFIGCYKDGSISNLINILREGDSEICIAAHKVSFLKQDKNRRCITFGFRNQL